VSTYRLPIAAAQFLSNGTEHVALCLVANVFFLGVQAYEGFEGDFLGLGFGLSKTPRGAPSKPSKVGDLNA
jgi:hypothetical protein